MKSFRVTEFGSPLQEVDQPTPQPVGTQVLIKVKAAGVCHSDLHIWEGGYDLGHGRKPLSLKDRGVLMLLDPRIQRQRYGRIFLDSLPPYRLTQSIEDVEAFFAKP